MEVFKGKEFTFTSEWLRRRGLQGPGFKAWLTYRKKGLMQNLMNKVMISFQRVVNNTIIEWTDKIFQDQLCLPH